MHQKPTLYLESTIPSYLTARPSRDLIVAAHQQITHEWWVDAKGRFELHVSEGVLEEISAGDPDAAQRRLAIVEDLPVLRLSDEVLALALLSTRAASDYPAALSWMRSTLGMLSFTG